MNDTKGSIRPNRPKSHLAERVSARIERLLARCDRQRRGSTIDRQTTFNREGQQHAAAVAERDRGVGPFPKHSP